MNLKSNTRLATLKESYANRIMVPLTKQELLIVLQMRQGDQMTFSGLDSEFELMFAEGVVELHKAMNSLTNPKEVPSKEKGKPSKKKAAVKAVKKDRPGGDEIIVRNEATE